VQNKQAYLKYSIGYLCFALSISMLSFFKAPVYGAKSNKSNDKLPTNHLHYKCPNKNPHHKKSALEIAKMFHLPLTFFETLDSKNKTKNEYKGDELIEEITNKVFDRIANLETINSKELRETVAKEIVYTLKSASIASLDDIIILIKRIESRVGLMSTKIQINTTIYQMLNDKDNWLTLAKQLHNAMSGGHQ
jgi:hypothetical protein